MSPATEDEVADAIGSAEAQRKKSRAANDADLDFAILATVRKHPRRYPSANKLYDAVGGTKATVLKRIKALTEDGRLVMSSDGFEAPHLGVAA